MPITPTTQIDPNTMARNWGPGMAAAAEKWLNKYQHPKRLFNADPAGAQANWASAIQSALADNRYATDFGAADPNLAAENAAKFGVNNFRAAGTNKAYKFQRTTQALAAALTSVRASVEATPRGPRGSAQNQQRMIAQAQGMAAYRGRIRSGR